VGSFVDGPHVVDRNWPIGSAVWPITQSRLADHDGNYGLARDVDLVDRAFGQLSMCSMGGERGCFRESPACPGDRRGQSTLRPRLAPSGPQEGHQLGVGSQRFSTGLRRGRCSNAR
jgi:hypothetical protein